MGFFSKLWGGIKDVFKGILNVFRPILEPVAKFLDTGIGKAIMAGLSIFTLGTAFVAAQGAYAATMTASQSFSQAFVAGAKQFFTTVLTGEGFEAGGQAGATAGATGQQAGQVGGELGKAAVDAGGMPNLVEGTEIAAEAGLEAAKVAGDVGVGGGGALPGASADALAGGMSGLSGAQSGVGGASDFGMQAMKAGSPDASVLAQGVKAPSRLPEVGTAGDWVNSAAGKASRREALKPMMEASSQAGKKSGWLSKAASAARDFAQSEGGGNVLGSVIQGVGNYYTSKDQQEFQDRIRRQWMDPNDPGVRGMQSTADSYGNMSISPTAPSMGGVPGTNNRPRYSRRYAGAGG